MFPNRSVQYLSHVTASGIPSPISNLKKSPYAVLFIVLLKELYSQISILSLIMKNMGIVFFEA